MPIAQVDLLDLVLDVHRAALEPSLWPGLLDRLSDATNNDGITVFLADKPGVPSAATCSSVDPGFRSAWSDYYWKIDPWCQIEDAGDRTGGLRLASDDFSASELAMSECYNDLWLARGFSDGFSAMYQWSDVGNFSGVTGLRRSDRGEYTREDIVVLRALSGHLQQALAVDQTLRGVRRNTEHLSEALDHFPTGVIVLDERGQVIRTNRAADEILSARDGLSSSREGLRAAHPQQARQLARLIRDALQTSNGEGLETGGALALERPSGGRALSVLVNPIGSIGASLADSQAGAIVFVSDQGKRRQLPTRTLSALWELTPAEARLTARLAAGLDLAEAANEMTVEVSTARQYLKRVFQKTGTHRQPELVLLVARALETAPELDDTWQGDSI